jgi:hypothetical protein
MPLQQSLYDIAEHQQDDLLNRGYSYEGNIFKNTMSAFLFLDPTRTQILGYLEAVYFELIERVKTIKTFYDYGYSKNDRTII